MYLLVHILIYQSRYFPAHLPDHPCSFCPADEHCKKRPARDRWARQPSGHAIGRCRAASLLSFSPAPSSAPRMSRLSTHASAITVCHAPATPHPPPLAGGSATICRDWFISPNFPREHGVPIWCPCVWASESQVAEQRVKKKPSCILPAKRLLWCTQRKLLACTTYPTMSIE